MTVLHHVILIFKGPLKHAMWIHDVRMNVQEKSKIKIMEISFSSELHTCDNEDLKQRDQGQCHDFLHKVIIHYKNNQVNAQFERKTIEKRDAACCWIDQKPFNAQLNKLEQYSSFK